MVDFNSIIKLINTNNDKIIQKSEVETYLKQQKNESIFTGYFASINSDVEVKTFKRELKRIDKEFKSYEKKEAKADKKHSFAHIVFIGLAMFMVCLIFIIFYERLK